MGKIDDSPRVGRGGVKVQAEFTEILQNGSEIAVIALFQC